jgi:hypothetical protein
MIKCILRLILNNLPFSCCHWSFFFSAKVILLLCNGCSSKFKNSLDMELFAFFLFKLDELIISDTSFMFDGFVAPKLNFC